MGQARIYFQNDMKHNDEYEINSSLAPLTPGSEELRMADNDKLPAEVESEPLPAEQEDQEDDLSPFVDYLKSPQGHEIASRVVGIVEDVKKATIDKNYSHAIFNRWLEAGVIVVVVGAVVWLSIVDKLNPTVGVLLGSVVGYFFGRNK